MSLFAKHCRARNYLKYRIAGRMLPSYAEWTETEALLAQDINDKLHLLLKEFDSNSRKLGYTVPDKRCTQPSCRCIVKHSIIVHSTEHYYCKKHFKAYLQTYLK